MFLASLIAVLALTACLSAADPQSQSAPRFDGQRAFEHIRQLVEIGPRPSGSVGSQRAREYITRHLKSAGWTIAEQAFDAVTPLGVVRMVNIRATFGDVAAGDRIIVAGHYDTKLFLDFRFVGANDGGSSTALLLELGRVLAIGPQSPRARMPIELLFLDGEEAVIEWQGTDHTYGSRHYVDTARRTGDLKHVRALVLVDMVGDRHLRIPRESQSTPWLSDVIWSTAKRLGRTEFVDDAQPIEDDHLEFLRAGVPAVDIIDFDYPAWHTAADTLDQVSASSLEIVGDVVLGALPEIDRRLRERR